MSFIKQFSRVQRKMYENSRKKGFHDADTGALAESSQRLMLIVSELSEALEALRYGDPPDGHIPNFSGMEAELADAVIRIMDLAETLDLRLAQAIIAKAAYNSRRPKMHGGKKF